MRICGAAGAPIANAEIVVAESLLSSTPRVVRSDAMAASAQMEPVHVEPRARGAIRVGLGLVVGALRLGEQGRDAVEGRQLLGQHDRLALRHDDDAGAELEPWMPRPEVAEGDDRLEDPAVVAVELDEQIGRAHV